MRSSAVMLLAVLMLGGGAGASPTIAGCPVFPASNPWNQRVDKLPVAPNSAEIIRSIGIDDPAHADFGSGLWEGSPIGIPYNVVSGSEPKVHVRFEYADESDKGPYPIPANPKVEGGSDHHILIVDGSSCRLYELGGAERTDSGWTAWAGAIWNLRSNAVRPATWTSADAAGLPILPGLARYGDLNQRASLHGGAHATRVRLPRAALRERLDRRFDAADGPPRPAEGELRHELVPAADARRAPDAEALRDDPGRQRLELVHHGRAGPALVERRPA
jgi:hypothetical protein